MKRALMICVAALILLVLAGCWRRTTTAEPVNTYDEEPINVNNESNNEQEPEYTNDEVLDTLEFSSLRDFLTAYLIVTGGIADEDIADLVTRYDSGWSRSDVNDVAARANLAGLETLYIPAGIPENYQLQRIRIDRYFIDFRFLHERDMISEAAIRGAVNTIHRDYFFFYFSRFDLQIPLDKHPMFGVMNQHGASESDLVEGRYLFVAPDRFIWATREVIFCMELPLRPRDARGMPVANSTIVGIPLDEIPYRTEFNELYVLDLRDTQAVLDMIESLPTPTPSPPPAAQTPTPSPEPTSSPEPSPSPIPDGAQGGGGGGVGLPRPSPSPSPQPPAHLLRFEIGNSHYTHNGVPMIAEAAPFIAENRAHIPLRIIAEALGAQVDWNPATRTGYMTKGDITVYIVVDQPLPDGMGTPVIINNRTFVPARYISETFGAEVRWDRSNAAVYVYPPE